MANCKRKCARLSSEPEPQKSGGGGADGQPVDDADVSDQRVDVVREKQVGHGEYTLNWGWMGTNKDEFWKSHREQHRWDWCVPVGVDVGQKGGHVLVAAGHEEDSVSKKD